MSSVDLSNINSIAKTRPELKDAVAGLVQLLADRASLKILDFNILQRELGGRVSIDELVELLHELRVRGIARLVYRVLDRNGYRTLKRFTSLSDKPEYDIDREGNGFEVDYSNVEQTYELAQ